jgi:hypothetical protein
VDVKAGWNLFGVPFGELNSTEGTNIQTLLSGSFSAGEYIQYWDGIQLISATYRTRNGVSGWYKNFNTLSDKVFKPGESFWLNVTTDKTVTVSGRIVDGEEGTVSSLSQNFTLVGASIPSTFNISDIQFDENIAAGDYIQYWDGTKLVSITYRTRNGVTGWYKNFSTLSDKVFQPCEGFWLHTKNAVNVTFPSSSN